MSGAAELGIALSAAQADQLLRLLDELPQAFEPYVKGAVTGRAVVKIG